MRGIQGLDGAISLVKMPGICGECKRTNSAQVTLCNFEYQSKDKQKLKKVFEKS